MTRWEARAVTTGVTRNGLAISRHALYAFAALLPGVPFVAYREGRQFTHRPGDGVPDPRSIVGVVESATSTAREVRVVLRIDDPSVQRALAAMERDGRLSLAGLSLVFRFPGWQEWHADGRMVWRVDAVSRIHSLDLVDRAGADGARILRRLSIAPQAALHERSPVYEPQDSFFATR
jgi:hypothetical protein